MVVYELVGVKNSSFRGSDGNQVSGVNFHFTYEDPKVEGIATERVFVHSNVFARLTFVPQLGGKCQLVYNRYGKVADIVPA